MLTELWRLGGVAPATIRTAILYRGPTDDRPPPDESTERRQEEERRAAETLLGARTALLEIVAEPEAYLESVADLVTGPRVDGAARGRDAVRRRPLSPDANCDGCLYNEFCMKWSAERDDLSLLPHLTAGEKARAASGHRDGARSGALKEVRPLPESMPDGAPATTLVPAPGREADGGAAGRHLAGRAAPRRADPPRPALPQRARRPATAGALSTSRGLRLAALFRTPTRTRTSSASTSTPSTTTCTTGSTCSARWSSPARRARRAPRRRRAIVRLTDGPPDTSRQGGAPVRRLDRARPAAGDRRRSPPRTPRASRAPRST